MKFPFILILMMASFPAWGSTILVTADEYYQGDEAAVTQELMGELKSLIFAQLFEKGHIVLDNDFPSATPWETTQERDELLKVAQSSGAQKVLTLYLVWSKPNEENKVLLEELTVSVWDLGSKKELGRKKLFTPKDQSLVVNPQLSEWLKFLNKGLGSFVSQYF